ncbi:hypothetical protein [Antarctobacter sp.]|uniref:COG3904 family protein n=1 Tax=Antarctobacter sp. TaxID=1872577 RepID=UPI003A92944B
MKRLILICFLLVPNRITAATIEETCMMRFCVLEITGVIDKATVLDVAKAIINQPQLDAVFLSSPGGDLKSGLDIGRLFRANFIRTIVRSGEECSSACAYAFLGGVDRTVESEGSVGFHRFLLPEGTSRLVDANTMIRQAQALSGELLEYTITMGADARLFVKASATASDEMFYPDAKERLDYAIDTPPSFDDFYLSPIGAGVAAVSLRDHTSHRFDNVSRVSLFCRQEQSYVAVQSTIEAIGQPIEPMIIVVKGKERVELKVPAKDIQSNVDGQFSIYTVKLSERIEVVLTSAEVIELLIPFSYANGGDLRFSKSLNKDEHGFIAASLRLCI